MASTALSAIEAKKRSFLNFMNFLISFLRRKAKPADMIAQALNSFQELLNINKMKKKIAYRINYEKYKLKKTELILAQNQDHVFIKGRRLNQIR